MFADGQYYKEMTCGESSKWSTGDTSIDYKCSDCPYPPTLANTATQWNPDLSNRTVGSVLTYNCPTGYEFPERTSSRQYRCNESKKWVSTDDTLSVAEEQLGCQRKDCGPIPCLNNSLAVIENEYNTAYEGEVTYLCLPGYAINGSHSGTVQCMSDGKWEITSESHIGYNLMEFQCTEVDCGLPSPFDNASVDFEQTILNSIANFTCDIGYVFNNSYANLRTVQMKCLTNGQWSFNSPKHYNSCQPIDCGVPRDIKNTTYNYTLTTLGETVEYSCSDGYQFNLNNQKTLVSNCSNQGSWSFAEANILYMEDIICEPINCSPPKCLENSILLTNGYSFGTANTHFCDLGYHLPLSTDTALHIVCQSDGTWASESASHNYSSISRCEAIDCGNPTRKPNAQISELSSTTYQSTFNYTCEQNYYFPKRDRPTWLEYQCMESGIWQPILSGSVNGCVDFRTTTLETPITTLSSEFEETTKESGLDSISTTVHDFWTTSQLQTQPGKSNSAETSTQPATADTEKTFEPTTDSDIVTESAPTENTNAVEKVYQFGDITTASVTPDLTIIDDLLLESPSCSEGPDWVRHTDVVVEGTRPGDRAVYVCMVGVKFIDGTTIRSVVCQSDGSWEQLQEMPEYVTCREFGTESNRLPSGVAMQKDGEIAIYDSRRMFTCVSKTARFSDGMISKEAVCSSNGQWSFIPSGCIEDRCLPATYVSKATLSGTSVDKGALVDFTCSVGHSFSDGTVLKRSQCIRGEWDLDSDQCSKNFCPRLSIPTHATLSTFKTEYQTIVELRCDLGYIMKDFNTSKIIECLASKQWNDSYSNCSAVRCDPPPVVPYAEPNEGTNTGGRNYGATVLYECDRPRKAKFEDGTTEKTIECNEYQKWNDTMSACSPTRCIPAPTIEHATPDRTLPTDFDTQIAYTCDPGYKFTDGTYKPKNVTCLHNGDWNITGLNCTEIRCLDPLNTTNGNSDTNSIIFGTNVTITCDIGNQINGRNSDTTFCNVSEKWEPSIPACDVIRCPYPDHLTSVRWREAQKYGYLQSFQCPRGMWFTRDKLTHASRCGNPDGSWIPSIPLCIDITCPPIPTWVGIQLNETRTGIYPIDSVINYTCTALPEGHVNNGDHLISSCSATGRWVPAIICYDNSTIQMDKTTVDAEGSVTIGTVVIVTLVMVQSLIVISEFPLMGTQIRNAFTNIRHANFWK